MKVGAEGEGFNRSGMSRGRNGRLRLTKRGACTYDGKVGFAVRRPAAAQAKPAASGAASLACCPLVQW